MKMRLRFKLILSFSIVIIFMILIGYIGIKQGVAINKRVDDMYTQEVVVLENLDDLKSATYRIRGDILEYLLADRSTTRERLKREIKEQMDRIDEKINLYQQTRLSDEEKRLLNNFIEKWSEYENQLQKVYSLVEHGDLNEAEKYARKIMVQQFREARSAINNLMDYNVERAAKRREHSLALYASDKKFIIILILIATITSILISLIVSGNIISSTKEMSRIAHEIAENDLMNLAEAVDALASGNLTKEVKINARQVNIKTKDEIGELAKIFNHMVEKLQITGEAFNNTSKNLNRIMQNLVNNANSIKQNSLQLNTSMGESVQAINQVSLAIHDIAKGATAESESINETNEALNKVVNAIENVAKGAKEQAEAVDRVAASITEMTEQIQQVNHNTMNSRELGRKTSSEAEQGVQVINQTINSMIKIKETFEIVEEKITRMLERTSKISSIVEAMDEIADQTNLLAVNAAIEAAQAGEHGRGFAIVADEVRKLAERSSKAAKQINDLILKIHIETEETQSAMKNSIEVVENTAKSAQSAEMALAVIIDGVKAVVNEVEQIAISAQEMAIASEDVEKAITNIATTVDKNSKNLETVVENSKYIRGSLEKITVVSQNNSAAAEEVSAMVEEMSSQFYEVNTVAEKLSEISQDLFEIINEFEIKEYENLSLNSQNFNGSDSNNKSTIKLKSSLNNDKNISLN